jgi:hypothetical protein
MILDSTTIINAHLGVAMIKSPVLRIVGDAGEFPGIFVFRLILKQKENQDYSIASLIAREPADVHSLQGKAIDQEVAAEIQAASIKRRLSAVHRVWLKPES